MAGAPTALTRSGAADAQSRTSTRPSGFNRPEVGQLLEQGPAHRRAEVPDRLTPPEPPLRTVVALQQRAMLLLLVARPKHASAAATSFLFGPAIVSSLRDSDESAVTLPPLAIQGRYHVARVHGGSGSGALRPQSDAPTSARKAGGSKGGGASPCQTAMFNVACAGLGPVRGPEQALRRHPRHLSGHRPERRTPARRGQAPQPLGRLPRRRRG